MKADFQATYETLKPNIDSLIDACWSILNSTSLKEFLRFALHTGNFINAVSGFV